MKIIDRLLRKNMSAAQMTGFVLSNIVGMAIVIAGVQFYQDMRSFWESEDSFITRDYIVVNKKVTSSNALGVGSSEFTEEEVSDLRRQPWVRRADGFRSLDYRVSASVAGGDRNMSTDMFFESIPTGYIDVEGVRWDYTPGSDEVPVIISKNYLTLYNFGFATSAGLPQMSEQMMSAVPLQLRLYSAGGGEPRFMQGRVVGYSNRLNTILVPEEFMIWSNKEYGHNSGSGNYNKNPQRLIVEVSSPGDVAIDRYMEDKGLEIAGDKSGAQASYLLNVVSGVIVGIGVIITVLSFFILMLSISLLLQKNRDKLHALIMLGYNLSAVAAPYCRVIVAVSVISYILSVGMMFILRGFYINGISGLLDSHTTVWASLCVGLALTFLMTLFNIISVKRKVVSAFR